MLSFNVLHHSQDIFKPRLGLLSLPRSNGQSIDIPTPTTFVSAPRGVVPHLSTDHLNATTAIRWINVPLDSFLENTPPIPTLLPGGYHQLLSWNQQKNVVSVSLRNPGDDSHVPASGKNHVSVMSPRGCRKISPDDYNQYLAQIKPDMAIVQADDPTCAKPLSQKRITKSLERSTAWLMKTVTTSSIPCSLLGHLVGDISCSARRAFAETLKEPPDENEKRILGELSCLDDGIHGYFIDMISLRRTNPSVPSEAINEMLGIRESLLPLEAQKPRIVSASRSPHEALQLIYDTGVDVVDVPWAFDAAQWGVALTFQFPGISSTSHHIDTGKIALNLYGESHRLDFSSLNDTPSVAIDSLGASEAIACHCLACAPVLPNRTLEHSPSASAKLRNMGYKTDFDEENDASRSTVAPSMTRAYIHHLLHTHEMGAHALLVMHNLTVLDTFFAAIRTQLSASKNDCEMGQSTRPHPVRERFDERYGSEKEFLKILDEGKQCWSRVERERGKGRLKRDQMNEEIEKV